MTRCFEPDAPNFTPRISGILQFAEGELHLQNEHLEERGRTGFRLQPLHLQLRAAPRVGHFIHTYNCDGNPIPTFTGRARARAHPRRRRRVRQTLWGNLNENNKISLYVRYTDLASGASESVLINKNQ